MRVGDKIGKLEILKRVENFEGSADSRKQFLCLCDCGRKIKVVARNLMRGKKDCNSCQRKRTSFSKNHSKSFYHNEHLIIKPVFRDDR